MKFGSDIHVLLRKRLSASVVHPIATSVKVMYVLAFGSNPHYAKRQAYRAAGMTLSLVIAFLVGACSSFVGKTTTEVSLNINVLDRKGSEKNQQQISSHPVDQPSIRTGWRLDLLCLLYFVVVFFCLELGEI